MEESTPTENVTHAREDRKKIRHIVLSGGGGIAHSFYGALRESNKDGFWNIEDIQSVHATSVGTICAIFTVTVKYIGWDAYDDFIIKRPWETVLELNAENILNSYKNVGIFNRNAFDNMMSPVLKSVDLPLTVTLQEFYDFVGIEMHFYATDLTQFELVDFSYKTHPDWKLLDVAYCSSALPVLFQPFKHADRYYADGAIFCNYPIAQCVKMASDPEEIFGLNKTLRDQDKPLEQYGNLVEYLLDILTKIMMKLEHKTADIAKNNVASLSEVGGFSPTDSRGENKNYIAFPDEFSSTSQVYNAIKTKESRLAKVQTGVDLWNEFKLKIGFEPVV